MGDIFDPVPAKAAGGAESLSPVPPTLSVSNPPANGPTSSSGTQEGNDGEKQSSHVGAIIGGVIGGLALLAATAVVVWIFLRRRVLARGDGNSNYPDYTKVSTGPPTAEHEIPPSHPRLYVGSLASCLARILTNFRRTRLIRQLTPATLTTLEVDLTELYPKTAHYTSVPEL